MRARMLAWIIALVVTVGTFSLIVEFGGATGAPLSERLLVAAKQAPTATAPLAEVLARLDRALADKAPAVARQLRKSQSLGAINAQLAAMGIALHPDLAALFAWHDGMAPIMPGGDLRSLALISNERQVEELRAQVNGAKAMATYRSAWIKILEEPYQEAGGWYVDGARPERPAVLGVIPRPGQPATSGRIRVAGSLAALLERVAQGWEQGLLSADTQGNVRATDPAAWEALLAGAVVEIEL